MAVEMYSYRRPYPDAAARERLAAVELLGTAAGLPTAVLGLSPFHHVAAFPVEQFEPLSTVALAGLGLLAALLGIVAFGRRDLTGG